MPRLPGKDALFLMMNSFKRVFPIFVFFFLALSAHTNRVLPREENESDCSLWASRGTLHDLCFRLRRQCRAVL